LFHDLKFIGIKIYFTVDVKRKCDKVKIEEDLISPSKSPKGVLLLQTLYYLPISLLTFSWKARITGCLKTQAISTIG